MLEGLDKRYWRRLPLKRVGKSTRKCVVCVEEFRPEEVIRILPCAHYFHNACLKPWFERNSQCIICRLDIKKFFEEDD